MKDKECLYEDSEVKIFKEHGVSERVRKLLVDITWGSEGTHYNHAGGDDKVKTMFDPYVLSLENEKDLIGCALFCRRNTKSGSREYSSFYTRYFATSLKYRGKGLAKKYGAKSMELIRKGVSLPTLFYAVVEKKNFASRKIVESVGYQKVATIKTIGFSRFFPKRKGDVRQLTASELLDFKPKLKSFYENHSLVQFESLSQMDAYYVLEKNGEIVAGAQFENGAWQVREMPGFMGKLIVNFVPLVPILNRVFNPADFRFLGIEAPFFKEGFESSFLELVEGVMSIKGMNSAMSFMDERSFVYSKLKSSKLGVLNTFCKDADSYLMLASENISNDDLEGVKQYPVYVSAFDLL